MATHASHAAHTPFASPDQANTCAAENFLDENFELVAPPGEVKLLPRSCARHCLARLPRAPLRSCQAAGGSHNCSRVFGAPLGHALETLGDNPQLDALWAATSDAFQRTDDLNSNVYQLFQVPGLAARMLPRVHVLLSRTLPQMVAWINTENQTKGYEQSEFRCALHELFVRMSVMHTDNEGAPNAPRPPVHLRSRWLPDAGCVLGSQSADVRRHDGHAGCRLAEP